MILTNHNDKGADDDIAAANELLETSGVDLTIKDSTSKPRQNQDKTWTYAPKPTRQAPARAKIRLQRKTKYFSRFS